MGVQLNCADRQAGRTRDCGDTPTDSMGFNFQLSTSEERAVCRAIRGTCTRSLLDDD